MNLLALQFEAEEAVEAFEDERREMERKHRQKQRELLKKATTQGVDTDQIAETLLPLEQGRIHGIRCAETPL